MDGSLDYCTTMWLEHDCQQLHKWDKIHYGKAFMSLHSKVSPETEVCLLVQRWEGALEPLPDNKKREEKENEEISLINALNPRDTMFVAGGPPQSPSPLQATPEIGPREPMAPPLYEKGQVSPTKTCQDAHFDTEASLSEGRQFPLRQYLTGRVTQGAQPTGYDWASTSFSTITELEEFQPFI